MKLTAIIEIPQNSIFKYEYCKKTNLLKLDRPLNQPIPHNYGYLPNTLCEDLDPIDVFVLTDAPIYPLTQVEIELISVLKCVDNGKADDKLIAVLAGDCRGYETMGIAIIQNYLETYKEGFKILGFGDKEEAVKVYEDSVKMYQSNEEEIRKAIEAMYLSHSVFT